MISKKKYKWIFVVLACAITLTLVVGYKASFVCRGGIKCLEERDGFLQRRLKRNVPLFTSLGPGETTPSPSLEKIQLWLDKHTIRISQEHKDRKNKSLEISCAVVGNGITLRESGLGTAIDKHEYVFRMNNAPITGFEKDVGRKTTFNVLVNNYTSHIGDYGQDTTAVVWGGVDTLAALNSQIEGKPKTGVERQLVMTLPDIARVVLLSSEFLAYVNSTPHLAHHSRKIMANARRHVIRLPALEWYSAPFFHLHMIKIKAKKRVITHSTSNPHNFVVHPIPTQNLTRFLVSLTIIELHFWITKERSI